jgi:hypothetical protein
MILVFIWFQEHMYQIGAFQGMIKWSWPNVKIIITTRVYLTRGPSGPDPKPSGPRGRPARVWGGSTRALVSMRLHKEEKAESVKNVGGGRSTWPATWVGRPATTWCQTDLSMSVEVPFTPINTPLMVKVKKSYSTCSSPLVKVPV